MDELPEVHDWDHDWRDGHDANERDIGKHQDPKGHPREESIDRQHSSNQVNATFEGNAATAMLSTSDLYVLYVFHLFLFVITVTIIDKG